MGIVGLDQLLALLSLVVVPLALLAVLAATFGVDSRDGVGDSHRGGQQRPWI